ncbi:MAG TPA: NUDIX domain-containing protein [Jatrophihabitans sp.]|jgi:ADP-ribose pyrophosphatase YjhB (NUDIX family)|nr:NUDIX domain-containing protein [Jatrophihabitans sp.]
MERRQPCAGAIVYDNARRLLLIRRGQAPSQGLWSVPGGRCRPGEAPADACVREAVEETGLAVAVLGFAGRVERAAPDGGIYVIDDFVCRVVGGVLRAGDDAMDARWVTRTGMLALDLVPDLYATLDEWGVLPD